MVALAERPTLKKYTDQWLKCESCKYGNNFLIEIKKDEKNDAYYYGEKCPRCNAYGEFKEISAREARRFSILEDLA